MADRNVSGQAYSLTVMAPIAAGQASELTKLLDELELGDASPLARIGGTHFARFVVIDNTVFEGGRQRPDPWSGPRLLFTSNFDGKLDPYLERLRAGLGEEADRIWGHCDGFPGHRDAAGFAAWIKHHQIDTSLFYTAYGEQTVEQVQGNLGLRQRLNEFAVANQGATPAELKARFLAEFR
jgi:hypothetical protein